MRVGQPARKHGIADDDIHHAARTAMRRIPLPDNLTMLIGPSRSGALLEIGVLDLYGDDPVAIHAMPLRPKYAQFLN